LGEVSAAGGFLEVKQASSFLKKRNKKRLIVSAAALPDKASAKS
jgi:hypothetical protein